MNFATIYFISAGYFEDYLFTGGVPEYVLRGDYAVIIHAQCGADPPGGFIARMVSSRWLRYISACYLD